MRLIEKVWFEQHNAKWVVVPLLLPLSFLFWLLSTLRRFLYAIGLLKQQAVDKPVIVVGNIGVGGNGKTPVVVYLVDLAQQLGFHPGIISRGYGGKAPHYPYLLNDQSTATEAGDEPILIFNRCQVPVVVGSDRVADAQLLIAHGCDLIISDDGLQHYRLARDIELLVIDNKRLFGNGLLLPAGPLREGLWRLKQADLLIFNGKKSVESKNKDKNKNAKADNDEKMLSMTLSAIEVVQLSTGIKIPLAEFIEKSPNINAIAGIGDPKRFFETLSQCQFTVVESRGFVDHQQFVSTDFDDFQDNIPLLMTEKDAVKCQQFTKPHWWYLPVNATLSLNDQQKLIEQLQGIKTTFKANV